jgi:transcription elongation factor SPT6
LAISAGRTLFDPLVEYAHLCNSDQDFLGLRVHKLQNYVSPQELAWCFQREFINRVSEVGVDINYCIGKSNKFFNYLLFLDFPHTESILQFVCGLGPRKAAHIIQLLKHQGVVLDARSKLVTLCNLGSTVFVNAAGFIRIDLEKVRDTAEDYVEPLDSSRIHPEA